MTKTIDVILTTLFLILFGWATIHGLTYDTFNDDATYTNTQLDRILPIISIVGNVLVLGSIFSKTKHSYLTYRLIGVGLTTPLIINYLLMRPIDTKSIIIESLIIVVFVCLSLIRRFTKSTS